MAAHRPSRAAFTLIELLVVISIIAILAGMILAVMQMIRENAKAAKTKGIINGAAVGLATTAMRTNVNISPVEHPMANTLTTALMPRSAFVRGEDIAALTITAGEDVLTTGEALRVADPATLAPSEKGRLMLPTDHYVGVASPTDTDSPLIYGMQRRYLTIIGSGYGLHGERRLPSLDRRYDRDADGVLDSPPYVDSPGAPNIGYPATWDAAPGDLTNATALEIEQKKIFDFALGPEVMSELGAMNGIRSADSADSSTLISRNRLRSHGVETYTGWDEQRRRDSVLIKDTDGTWKRARLRGPALYDAWGHEILCWTAPNGTLVFESAGKDGVFRWNPGGDGVYQTAAHASAPAGDDRDGRKDNLLTGQR